MKISSPQDRNALSDVVRSEPVKAPAEPRWLSRTPAVIAVAAGVGMFLVGTGAESLIIRAVSGSRSALEWISDTFISIAVASLAYLWLHLKESRSRLLDVERSGIVLAEQLRLAANIQRNLLPDVPATSPGFAWAARMVPAGQVGGDFYDFVESGNGTTLVFLGDISGKGIPAALLHSSLRAVFRLIALDTHDPVLIAERIGSVLYGQTGGTPYATAIVACFDRASMRLTYVNAGHPFGLVFRDGEERMLDVGGSPLGMLPGVCYVAGCVDLQPGDLGVLVTDGITEALEGRPTSVREVLRQQGQLLGRGGLVEDVCDLLLAVAALGPGPPGAGTWQDDATAFVFRVV